MINISLDHIKAIIKSAIASATRYKPNLEVTDPDDPRYVAGKLPKEKLPNLGLAKVAKTGNYNDLINTPNPIETINGIFPDYNGNVEIEVPAPVTDEHINSLIDKKLGVIENGSY